VVVFRIAVAWGAAYFLRMTDAKQLDPTGLIREAYRIDGITDADCRGIYFDWAVGLADGLDPVDASRELLAKYAEQPSDHPMTVVLRAAVEGQAQPRRRGGAMGRRR